MKWRILEKNGRKIARTDSGSKISSGKLNLPNPFKESIPQSKWKTLVKASIREEK